MGGSTSLRILVLGSLVAILTGCGGMRAGSANDSLESSSSSDNSSDSLPSPSPAPNPSPAPAPAPASIETTRTVNAGADLQTEIDSLPRGGTLRLNSGVYDLSSSLVINKAFTLIGTDANNRPQIRAASDMAEMIKLDSAELVLLQDLDFRAMNRPLNVGIHIIGGQASLVHINLQDIGQSSNTSSNYGIGILPETAAVTYVGISNSSFSNIGAGTALGMGLYAQGPTNSSSKGVSGLYITGNTFDTIGRTAIEFQGGVTQSYIQYNTIRNTGSGSPRGCVWNLQSADNCVKMSFESYSPPTTNEAYVGRDNVIENNHVDHWISLSNTRRTAVRRNFVDRVLSEPTGSGDNVGIENTDGINNIIDSNKVTGRHVVGISASGKTTFNVYSRNTIEGHATDYAGQINYGFEIMGQNTIDYNFFVGNTVSTTYISGQPSFNVILGSGTANQVFAGNSFNQGSIGFADFGGYHNNPVAGIVNGVYTNNGYAGFSSANIQCGDCLDQASNANYDFSLSRESGRTWKMNLSGNGKARTWIIDWGDGPPIVGYGDFSSVAHEYTAPGTYNVSITTWDDAPGGADFSVPMYRSHALTVP